MNTWTKLAIELEPGDVIIRKNRHLRIYKVEHTVEDGGVKAYVQDEATDWQSFIKFNLADEVQIRND